MIQLGISSFLSNFYERSWGSHLYLPLMTEVEVITDVVVNHTTMKTSPTFSTYSSVGSNTASMFLPVFFNALGSVVRRQIDANPGLNFNLGFFFFCLKTFFWIIFSLLFRASNHQIVGKRNKTEFAF